MAEHVVLVDERDNDIGTMEKMAAHEHGGTLHRAFSVFVFNGAGKMLLQQRALTKYHCGGLWTNTCCSHPREGESAAAAAHRRMQEENGFDCPLTEAFVFTYTAPFSNGLTEHEVDHVFIGIHDKDPVLNPEEAAAFAWRDVDELVADVRTHPDRYTPWFRIALPRVIEHIKR